MAPAATLIPALIGAGGAIGGSLLGRKSVQGSTRPSPMETAATGAQTGAANQLTATGGQLTRQGMPQLQQAGRYFSTLAGGNKAAMTQQLAPDIENIRSVYGGTARTLGRFLRGPEKDTQMAELERERAGQIGNLFRSGRPGANAALAGMGGEAVGAGTAATGAAGSIFGQQVGQGQAGRFAGADLQRQAGSDFGGLIFNLLKMYSQKGGGAGTQTLPSRMTVPPSTAWMPGG